jgi:type I restriction enzyme S subunit
MNKEFQTYKLGDVTKIFAGGDKPTEFSNVKTGEYKFPIYANGETNSGLQGFAKTEKVSEPAVTVSARGTIGYAALRMEPFVPIVRLLTLIPDFEKIELLYLYYYLKLYRQSGIGSSQAQLIAPEIANRTITLPNLTIQKSIGKVLSVLDSKIELNNRINAELEAMAKTLYDYWFVQFDFPDKNDKPYKTSGGKMVWNEELNREVPEGWEVKSLGDVCDLYQPQTISENEMNQQDEFFVFGANGIVGKYNKFNHIESEVVVTCRGNSCGIIQRTTPKAWITGNAMVIKPKNILIHNEFIYFTLKWLDIHRAITGSAQPQITRANLSPLRFSIPDITVLNKYSNFVNSNVVKRFKIFAENQKLAELRDWLLPMLMNGQVKVN